MNKKVAVIILCFAIAAVYYSIASFRTADQKHTIEHPSIPASSLEKQVCEKLLAKNQDCKRVLLFDADSQLLFAESSQGIIPVLTNKEFTEAKKMMPELNFQEFREEKEETGPIVWHVRNKVQKKLSIIYGFARDNAKTIMINSEGNIQPTRFFVRNDSVGTSGGSGTAGLWVWYVTVHQDKVKLPIQIAVYDAKGQMISGESNAD
jgi:hypothetical protein